MYFFFGKQTQKIYERQRVWLREILIAFAFELIKSWQYSIILLG